MLYCLGNNKGEKPVCAQFKRNFFSNILGLRLNESMGAEPADMEPTDAEHQLCNAMAGGAGTWGTQALPLKEHTKKPDPLDLRSQRECDM